MAKRSPRSPTRFVVARHLLSHPKDGPSELARHCQLQVPSASRALRRLMDDTALEPANLLEAMKLAQEKPRWRSFHFHAPNPAQWAKAAKCPHLLSGEKAAEAVDKLDLVSDRAIQYVREEDVAEALRAVKAIFAKSAAPQASNLVIRVADPWMDFTGNVAEKGQRWYDYATSSNLQLRRWQP